MSTAHHNPGTNDSRTLIDELLAEQRELTAVEKFSRAHDSLGDRSRLYRDLIPLTKPQPGQQYAFEVDLDKCTGCKACVSACHSLNGLDDDEVWRGVGMLVGDSRTAEKSEKEKRRKGAVEKIAPSPFPHFSSVVPSFQQHITTACHHCVDPACLNGCPVLAYDKDPLTGIVRHLDDQCIGCQYCVMMCPYEVPQYSKARGIVRKCDMCHSRLAVGEAPACVQACPTSAIKITVVEQAKVRGKYRALPDLNVGGVEKGKRGKGAEARIPFSPSLLFNSSNPFLPASPNPAITLPTTRYVTQRTIPTNVFAGDHAAVRPADPHLPLVLLLVLSQLAIGASVAALLVKPALPLLLGALVVGVVAMVAGSLHLGQPLKAWRSFLGWRKSWFSREVIAFGGFVSTVAAAAGAMCMPGLQPLESFLPTFAAVAGLSTVVCSAMIYVDTRREFWNVTRCFTKFFGTTLLLGTAAATVVLALNSDSGARATIALALLALVTLAKLAFEHRIFTQLVDAETPGQTPLNKTARLLAGELNGFVRVRIALALAGGVVLPLIALLQLTAGAPLAPALAIVLLVLCVAGELIERYLFFTAVATQKMPGGLAV